MRRKIERLEQITVLDNIQVYFDNNSLDEVIERLQSLRDTYKDKYNYLNIKSNIYDRYSSDDVEIWLEGITIESDEEYMARLERVKEEERAQKLREKQRQAEIEIAERATYEILKRKFEK